MNVAFNYGSWDLWSLYHKVTFDGANRIIYVNENVTELNIKTDVYSDWKEWVYSRDDNALWLPAIRAIGGDPTVAGQTAGDIYFLQNGWKLYIDLTKVKVSGVLFSDDFDSAYYSYDGVIQFPAQVSSLVSGTSAATPQELWTYNNRTLTQEIASTAPTTAEIAQAVWAYITRTLTESIGGGATPAEIWTYSSRTLTTTEAPSASATAAAVWNAAYGSYDTDGTFGHLLNYVGNLEKELWVNTELGTNGLGSQEFPYNDMGSAIDRAEEDGIRIINVIGDITLTKNFKNFTLKGIGLPVVNLNGQNVKNSKFLNVRITGAFVDGSAIIVQDSVILDGAFIEGFYENCALGGDLTCQDGANVLIKNSASNIPGTNRPTISMNPTGTSLLSVRGYNGGLTIKDCNNAADRVTVEMNPGSLTFDSSCTNGIMVARGVGKFVDQTNGATVVNETVNQSITATVEASVSAVQSTVNTINTNLTTVDGLVRTVDTVVDGIAIETASISSAIVTLQSSVDGIAIETASISSAIVTLQSSVDGIDITSLSSNIAAVESKIDIIDTIVDTMTVDLNTANANILNIDSDLERVENKIDIIDTNIDEIETIVREIDVSDLNSLSSAIAAVQISVDAIDVTTLSSNIAAVQASVNAIDTRSLSSNIAAVQTSIDAIDTRSLSANIAAVQTSVDAIDVTTLSSNIAAVQAAVDAIDTTSLSANIAAVQSSVDTIDAKLDTVDTNVDAIEAKVLELWKLAGLDVSNVASITDTTITVGGITITIGNPDNNTTTLTRS